MFVTCIYNISLVLKFPLKSYTKEEFLATFENLYEYLEKHGYKPNFHKFDNETSKLIKDFIEEQKHNLPNYTTRSQLIKHSGTSDSSIQISL